VSKYLPTNENTNGQLPGLLCYEYLFKLEKPLIEHLEGLILLPKEGGKLQLFFRTFNKNSSSRIQKNSPSRSVKAGALMVGGMFVITTMSC
jgi:hypothetical protein